MIDRNVEQRINISFYVKIVKVAIEPLALLTFCYGEHALKKSNMLKGISFSRKGENMWKINKRTARNSKYILISK
jgi:hypothetical protein